MKDLEAAAKGARLIRAAYNLLDFWGTRTEDGAKITVEWGEPDEYGVYEPTFTRHNDDIYVADATLSGAAGLPKKCRRHQWYLFDPALIGEPGSAVWACIRCQTVKDEARSRRGKQSRNYGNRAELKAANKYGGEKIGQAGGPVDIRGRDFATQVKTHRRLPPIEWTKSFAAMAQDTRCRRMLLRFVQGSGLPPRDYFVFEADDFLAWFGKDE